MGLLSKNIPESESGREREVHELGEKKKAMVNENNSIIPLQHNAGLPFMELQR